MSLAIDGLVSGLDTTSLINSLMQIEAGPQNLLKASVTASNSYVAALQGLNSSVASLATLATKTTKANALDLYSASSSSPTVTATAAAGASAGQIDIVVGKLAQAQSVVSDAVTAWPGASFTITSATGATTPIVAASGSIDDIVSAVNNAKAGVTAVKVAAGTNAGGQTLYRVQFTAALTGSASGFTLNNPGVGMTTVKAAQDAEVTLWAGTAAAQTITSSTNTFTALLPGVGVTVSAVATAPVTITVNRDEAAVSAVAKDLVGALNGIFASISTKSAVVNSTDSTGASIVSGSVFSGDSTVRDVNQRLLSAASLPVNGHSPSEIGISITKTGTMEFDAVKFAAALKKDPASVQATLQAIATRVATAAGDVSDKFDGQITSVITGQQSMVKNLGTQIDSWDRRLASRRSTLERVYSGMEVQLSGMKAQSAWLTSQLSALTTSTG